MTASDDNYSVLLKAVQENIRQHRAKAELLNAYFENMVVESHVARASNEGTWLSKVKR